MVLPPLFTGLQNFNSLLIFFRVHTHAYSHTPLFWVLSAVSWAFRYTSLGILSLFCWLCIGLRITSFTLFVFTSFLASFLCFLPVCSSRYGSCMYKICILLPFIHSHGVPLIVYTSHTLCLLTIRPF